MLLDPRFTWLCAGSIVDGGWIDRSCEVVQSTQSALWKLGSTVKFWQNPCRGMAELRCYNLRDELS